MTDEKALVFAGRKWNVELESCVYSFINIPRPNVSILTPILVAKTPMHLNG